MARRPAPRDPAHGRRGHDAPPNGTRAGHPRGKRGRHPPPAGTHRAVAIRVSQRRGRADPARHGSARRGRHRARRAVGARAPVRRSGGRRQNHMTDAIRLLPLTMLGALLGADVVSFPQAMLSRPIVAATLGGAIAGSVAAGLLTGAVLEMLAMETLPVGASRYPEWGSASLVGGALAGSQAVMRPGAIIVGVFVGIATAWAGGWSMYGLRRLNGVWAERAVPAMETGSRRAVMGLQLRGLTADLVRGALLTLIALLVWSPVSDFVLGRWTVGRAASHSVLAAVAAGVAGGAIWRQSHGAAGSKWYLLAGLALGIILLVAT